MFGTINENINTKVPEKYKHKYIVTNTVEELQGHNCKNFANKVDELQGTPNENINTKVPKNTNTNTL